MTLLQSVLFQVGCALTGSHKVSKKDEERLFESQTGELTTKCTRCNVSIQLTICVDTENTYKVREKEV
jgi:hypothetical protein